MRIVVEIDCRDPSLCGDCDGQSLTGYAYCNQFNRDLRRAGNNSLGPMLRCDECKAAEAYIERCDECNSDAAKAAF